MLVQNTGTEIIRIAVSGCIIEIKPQQACELNDGLYASYAKIFPKLKPVKESVIVEAEEKEIIMPKETKNVKGKKSRK